MAIDKSKAKELIDGIDNLFNETAGVLPETVRTSLKNKLLGPAFEEIRELISESRPPVFLLFGRSGHGKSSLINALAKKKVAEPSIVIPGTLDSQVYDIDFGELHASWKIIDTRGIFDPVKQGEKNAVDQLKEDIDKYKPDILIHVFNARELRASSNDFIVFNTEIAPRVEKATGTKIPTLVVLTNVDFLGVRDQWPPEKHTEKEKAINEAIGFAKIILDIKDSIDIDPNKKILGISVKGTYIGIIPVCTGVGDVWNIETLSNFIEIHLPKSAILDFVQVQKTKSQLKRLSSSIIMRFSAIATAIGAEPIPIADILILTPLQLLMISIIAGLSCRGFSKDVAKEYLVAAGFNVGTGLGLRVLAQQLVKLLPISGMFFSGAIAGMGTYAIGKAAEKYFFDNEIVSPENYKNEYKG